MEFSRVMPSSAEDFSDRSEQRIGIARAERKQQLRQSPIRTDAGENLLVLDLSRHDRARNTFPLEGINQLGEFAQR